MRRTFSSPPAAIRWALVAASSAMLAAAEPSKPVKRSADDAKKKSAEPALDDALLNDLDNELLRGAGDLKNGPKAKPADNGPGDGKSPAPRDDGGEDIGESRQDEDPLARISQEMRSAEDLIRELAKRNSAEQVQRRIVADLATLIEQAEKQSAEKSSSSKERKSQKTAKRQMVQQPKLGKSGKDSNKPAQDSTDRLGKAEDAKPDPQRLKEMMKDSWGHLPPHAREQMSQNWPERFLPQYELMIERYYIRLAEEQGSK